MSKKIAILVEFNYEELEVLLCCLFHVASVVTGVVSAVALPRRGHDHMYDWSRERKGLSVKEGLPL